MGEAFGMQDNRESARELFDAIRSVAADAVGEDNLNALKRGITIVVDFDGGFVYYFSDGNGDETCMRVRIDSGTLNDTVIVTFHDGDTQWSEGLHFSWARQPDHLVLEDHNHFTYDYSSTDIQKAFQICQTKTVYDY